MALKEKKKSLNSIVLIIAVIVFAVTALGLLIYEEKNKSANSEDPFSRISINLTDDNDTIKTRPQFVKHKNAYYVFLPSFSDTDKLCIEIPDNLSVKIDGIDISNGDVLKDIEADRAYSFETALKNKSPKKASLVFAKASGVSSMFINTASGSMKKIDSDKEHSETGEMQIVLSDGKTDFQGKLSSISGHGNNTWRYSKKPYNIKLSAASNLLGMGEAEKWVLLANAGDDTLIRNKLIYDFAEYAEVNYAVESEFVDLYLNGEYAGLYQLCEKVEVAENRIDIRDLDYENSLVNQHSLKKYNHVSFPLGNSGRNASAYELSHSPEDISGGYLVEFFDLDNDNVFFTDSVCPLAVESPDYVSTEEIKYLYSYFQEFEDAIKASDGINPSNGKHYTEYIDLDSFVLDYLIQEVFLNYDGGFRSWYMYKLPDSQGGLVYCGPVWDFDASLGNTNISPSTFYINRIEQSDNFSFHSWYAELYTQKDFYASAVSKYQELFVPYINNMIDSIIDSTFKEVFPSILMNNILWNCSGDFENHYQSEINKMKEYLSERLEFLQSAWIDETEYLTVRFDPENGLKDIFFSVLPGDTFTDFPEVTLEGYIFDGWYYEDTTPVEKESLTVSEDIYIKAKWTPDPNYDDGYVEPSFIQKLSDVFAASLDVLVILAALTVFAFVFIYSILRKRNTL